MLLKKIVFLLILNFLVPLVISAQPADGVIKKYIAFIGGKKNWQDVKTLSTSGEYNYGGIKFPFTAFSKAPDKYKFIVPFEGKYYAQAFDGQKGWKIDAFKNETTPTLLTGKDALAMANEADVQLEDPFINYKKKGHKVSLESNDTIDGQICVGIKLVRANGDVATYYFDERTAALVMKTAPSKNAELQGTLLNTMYSDYRAVNGIKIPFKSVSKSNDQIILEISIEKAQVNINIDDREFEVAN